MKDVVFDEFSESGINDDSMQKVEGKKTSMRECSNLVLKIIEIKEEEEWNLLIIYIYIYLQIEDVYASSPI